MSENNFFQKQAEQSLVKSKIVVKYFNIWARILLKQRTVSRVAYLDLFSGPGRYEETGEASTPLMILNGIIKKEDLKNGVITIFNDFNNEHAEALKYEISHLKGINQIKYYPKIYNYSVQDKMLELLSNAHNIPKLAFADPWGYKGLSLKLIRSIMKDFGSEVILFFNYNRIRISLTNNLVRTIMIDLFGKQRFEFLVAQLKTDISSDEKESLILDEFIDAVYSLGCKYVQPFRFQFEDKSSTSHYLIHISNHPLGHTRMKEIMAKISTTHDQGVASFEHNPKEIHQPLLFTRDRPLDRLEQDLLDVFAGKTLSMIDIYRRHNIGTNYTEKNYKEALKQLESDGRILTKPSSSQRRKNTFGDSVMVTFPERN